METLYVITCVSNPLQWETRINIAEKAVKSWLKSPNVHVTMVECVLGDRPFALKHLEGPNLNHIGLYCTTLAWSKESLLNIGMASLPPAAKKIAFFDADITFRRPHWAESTLAALDIFPVIQPWDTAYDLGPHDEHIQTHKSFCSLYVEGQPVIPNGPHFWKFNGGPYEYAHTGYAWAYVRTVLDKVGCLFEVGGMGSGDHHQALSLIGKGEYSMPGGTSHQYRECVFTWQNRALSAVNKKIGFAHGTIEHLWHGPKKARGYQSRWDMFLKHKFDPIRDLKKNTYGVMEWAGNNPELEREWFLYLKSRLEDCNTII